jgi:hypothetical protein
MFCSPLNSGWISRPISVSPSIPQSIAEVRAN